MGLSLLGQSQHHSEAVAETPWRRADTALSSRAPMHTWVQLRLLKTSCDVVWFAFGSLPRLLHVTSLCYRQ